jgi:hypothetical protein
MNRCMRCSGKFGLIRHRWWEYEFCSLTCKEAHVAEIARTRDRLRSWSQGPQENRGERSDQVFTIGRKETIGVSIIDELTLIEP